MKDNIIIRKARPGDEIGIAEIQNEGFKRKNFIYNGANKPADKEKIKKWKKEFSEKGKYRFVAIDKENNKLVGSIIASFKTEGRIRHRIDCGWGVHPDYQRQGIATRLLKTILVYAKKNKLKKAIAEVAIENIASIKLAKKCGFKIEGKIRKGLLLDNGRFVDTYMLGREL